jgi:hypothetical protein
MPQTAAVMDGLGLSKIATPSIWPSMTRSTLTQSARLPVAVDATGFAPGAVSSYFIRHVEHFVDKPRTWKHWLKWFAVVDLDRQIILVQHARQAPLERLRHSASAGAGRASPGSCRLRLGRCRILL